MQLLKNMCTEVVDFKLRKLKRCQKADGPKECLQTSPLIMKKKKILKNAVAKR